MAGWTSRYMEVAISDKYIDVQMILVQMYGVGGNEGGRVESWARLPVPYAVTIYILVTNVEEVPVEGEQEPKVRPVGYGHLLEWCTSGQALAWVKSHL